VKIVRSVVVISAAAAMALVPVAAQADTKSHHDPSGDVKSVAWDPATNQTTDTPSTLEQSATLGDITKVKVSHGASALTVVLRFRDLAKTGAEQIHEVEILTRTTARFVYVVAAPGHWKGRVVMTKPNHKRVRCSIGGHINYGKNTVTIKVPRSCLGHPDVVKIGAATLVGYGDKMYYDDGYSVAGEFTDPFVLSPKIHR
jgi:hypothetical protein